MGNRYRTATALAAFTFAIALASAAISQSNEIKGFVVDQQGRMGVGTSVPQEALHIAGNTYAEGLFMGGGIGGQFGKSAVISGFDVRYGQRAFVLSYAGTANAASDIQIHAINPANPAQSTFKTFIIDHPTDGSRHLVHAAIEGPEGAVFYRGSARLRNGRARVELPTYFEALTRAEGRTIQLTNVDGFDRLAVQTREGARIADGAFLVVSEDRRSDQRFDWEVKAVRADGPPLVVEPLKSSVNVAGAGPYTYQAPLPPDRETRP